MKLQLLAISAFALLAGPSLAITLDGVGIPSEGLTLQATQDAATLFGNADNASQGANGSELNQLFADINGGALEIGITGNLEANFNKLWIFIDAIDGGENTLLSDNADGGFGEINAMAGLTFPAGMTPDHGIRLEIGGGFYGVRYFDLLTNVGGDVATGGGSGDLPLSSVSGANGIDFGWDNSNVLGVDGADASGAATATTGFEFEIDMAEAFNGSQGDVNIVAFITNGGGDFASNQFLPGLGNGAANPGSLTAFTISNMVTVTGDPIAGALPGDVDGDGGVDLDEAMGIGGTAGDDGISDFDIIRMNWLETNDTFGQVLTRGDGDLNGNGEVGIEDFREWKNAFNGTEEEVAAAFALLTGATVPEPSTALLVAVLAGLAGRGRWRCN